MTVDPFTLSTPVPEDDFLLVDDPDLTDPAVWAARWAGTVADLGMRSGLTTDQVCNLTALMRYTRRNESEMATLYRVARLVLGD